MMFVCFDCGSSTDSDMGFCPRCGSYNVHAVNDADVKDGRDTVAVAGGKVMIVDKKTVRLTFFALMLAFIPGLMNVFGIGHLVLKKWVKGILYLCSSAAYFYLMYFSGYDLPVLYLTMATLVIFVVQMVDIYKICSKSIAAAIR
ncbi:MAG: hypothetical protein ACI4Q9_03715 [Candidatus Methanomethylophilaceae archaeon]